MPKGDITASYGTFGSSNGSFDLSYGQQKWGNFISLSGMNTGRFLDGPEYQVFHDHGNEENVFDRLDLKFSDKDTVNLNLWLHPNLVVPDSQFHHDAQTASAGPGLVENNAGLGPNGVLVGAADQRSQIRSF